MIRLIAIALCVTSFDAGVETSAGLDERAAPVSTRELAQSSLRSRIDGHGLALLQNPKRPAGGAAGAYRRSGDAVKSSGIDWGNTINPDGDCKIKRGPKVLTITVPATLHDLNSKTGVWNAPRITRIVEGDFVATVKLTGRFTPAGKSTDPMGAPSNAAGLFIWSDRENFVRLDSTVVLRDGRPDVHASLQSHASGKVETRTAPLSSPAVFLRLERRGKQISGSVSADGDQWNALGSVELEMPSDVMIGLTAFNTSSSPLTATFESLSLNVAPSQPQPKAADNAIEASPESAFRAFLLAMFLHDEPTLRRLTMPVDDFDWLLRGQIAPPEAAEEIRAGLAQVGIRRLKPGDTFTIPRVGQGTVSPDEVSETRAVLLPQDSPIPTRMHKINGRWCVDARPVIAGRKAADAARRKAEGRTQQQK